MMTKNLLISLMLASVLVGCSEAPTPKGQSAPEVQAPVDPGCTLDPKMSNTQIIAETHTCESNGLDAEAFHCGNDPSTIQIQCKPRVKE